MSNTDITYKEARKAFLEKYSDILNFIAKAEGVDPDSAINMFKKNILNGKCYGWKNIKEDLNTLEEEAKDDLNIT